ALSALPGDNVGFNVKFALK
uniref:Translation elongation factor EF-1 alpha n=1 Tax=Oryctolagus cuniculus TaxID=9986 RepID=Q7M2K4_RABIT